MKCSLGISHFLEEISSLSHSVVSLYFFALVVEEGFFFFFLISSCYSLELCIQMLISFLFSFAFRFSFHSYLYGLPRQPFCFVLHFFSMGMVLIPVSCSMSRTCLLRNLYSGQKATVRTGHGTTDWFKIGKGVCQGCILSPCSFNFYAEYIMRNAVLEEAQSGI